MRAAGLRAADPQLTLAPPLPGRSHPVVKTFYNAEVLLECMPIEVTR